METFVNRPPDKAVLSPESDAREISVEPVPSAWMGQEISYPREFSVVDFFREKVRQQPDAPAIQDGARIISYRELDQKSDLVAGALLGHGLRIEEPVAIMTAMSFEFLAGILGILKAGGCYFPIDPETPAKRLEFLLADCRARFLWLNSTSRERLGAWSGTTLNLPDAFNNPPGDSKKIPLIPSDPHRVAYLLYTSGSTGQPKGVQIEHHSLTNFVCYYLRHFKITPKDRSSLLTYIAFDVSVSDIWPTLCAGGTLVVPPKGILTNPDALIRWLDTQEITLSFVPTGLAEILFTLPWPKQMKLRYLVTGGDRLRVRPLAELPFTAINGYGPTESTVFATMSIVRPQDENNQPPPIGRSLDNVTAYVLDEKLQLLPIGAPGELYLGGVQLARGYLGRPDLTNERFVPDPFSTQPGARMYRTGDWARWLPDGELDFLGRKDGQIQIRGLRVELGEIEALLFAHPAVKQVCCVPRMINGAPTSVVAHLVCHDRSKNPSQELHDYLSAELPDYMVPSQFILHERLPLTPQGKADRAAMMAMPVEDPAPAKSEGVIEDGLDQALAALWHSLLPGSAQAPADKTFAELGGDSLLAVRLLVGVTEITGQQLEMSAFLVQPTFAGLCKAVKALMAQTEFQPVLTLRKQGNRPPLFFLYGLSGDIEIYFPLAEALGEDQPIYGIRSPGLENPSRLPSSIEAAAAEAIRFIRKVQPHGAPALVGHSWAGQLAFAVSRQLALTEGLHSFTAIIGSDAPRRRLPLLFRAAHFIKYFPAWLLEFIRDSKNRRQRIKHLGSIARDTQTAAMESTSSVPEWAKSPITRKLFPLMVQYSPQPKADVSPDIFRERDEFNPQAHPARYWDTCHLPDGGWSDWITQPPRIHWLDGNHYSILKPPYVAALAQSIRAAHDAYLKR